jgi:hypothetical protein
MGHAIAVRTNYTADEVRRLAKRVKDAAQARRLLAIAAVLDGASRTEAARIGGMDRQTLRDWVFNGLYDAKRRPAPIIEAACWSHGRRHFFDLATLSKSPIADGRGRTGAPRHVCTAPAGDPTATPSAARRRERPWQIDMVPGPRQFLTCLCERGAARAALGVDVACRVRVLCKRTRRAGTAFAAFFTLVGSASPSDRGTAATKSCPASSAVCRAWPQAQRCAPAAPCSARPTRRRAP